MHQHGPIPPTRKNLLAMGVGVLEEFLSEARFRSPHEVADADLLLHRSVQSLAERLRWVLEADVALDASFISPADVWTIDELMQSTPPDGRILASLRAELARVV